MQATIGEALRQAPDASESKAASPAQTKTSPDPAQACNKELLDSICRLLWDISSAVVSLCARGGFGGGTESQVRARAVASGQWVLLQEMSSDASRLLSHFISCQDLAMRCLDSHISAGALGSATATVAVGSASATEALRHEMIQWELAVESVKAIFLVLAIHAASSVSSGGAETDPVVGHEGSQADNLHRNADMSWWLIAQVWRE